MNPKFTTKTYGSTGPVGASGIPGPPGATTTTYTYWSNIPDTETEKRSEVFYEAELIEELRGTTLGREIVNSRAKFLLRKKYESGINFDAIDVDCIYGVLNGVEKYTPIYMNLYTYVLMCGINVPYCNWIYDDLYHNPEQGVTFYWSKAYGRYEKVKGQWTAVHDKPSSFETYTQFVNNISADIHNLAVSYTDFGEKQSKETKKQHKLAAKAYTHKVKNKPVNKHFNHRIKH